MVFHSGVVCDSPLMKRGEEKRSHILSYPQYSSKNSTLDLPHLYIYVASSSPSPHQTKPKFDNLTLTLTSILFTFPSFSCSSPRLIEMEDPSHRRHRKKTHYHHASNTTTVSTTTGESDQEVEEAGEGDPEVWATFNNSFRQVQSVLDRNRLLIQQVNENHQSRIPDNMAKNVSLIQELNGNISKVAHIYSDLNSEFTTMYQKRSNNSGSRRNK